MSMGTKSLNCSVRVNPTDLARVLVGLYGSGSRVKTLSSAISWCVETAAMAMEPLTDKQAMEVLELYVPGFLQRLQFDESKDKVDKFLKEKSIKKVESRLGTTLNLSKAELADVVCLSDEEIRKIQKSDAYKEASNSEETEWEKDFYTKYGIKDDKKKNN